MNLSYSVAPSDLLWTNDLFNQIQSFKAGSFDSSAVYEQFGWLIVPEIEVHGSAGPFTAYFAIKAGDSVTPFSIFNPLTDVAVWTVENHLPAVNILAASNMNLSFLSILAAGSATALEALLFAGADVITFDAGAPDSSNDVLRGWAGNDTLQAYASGGRDAFYGGGGNDRITISDGIAGSLQGVSGIFLGYGGSGRDTVLGDDRGDRLFGGTGDDSLVGNGGNDLVEGGAGADAQQGNAGRDTLRGGSGDDSLFAGLHADELTGGDGADLFIFTWGGTVSHFDSGTQAAARDVITDFTRGDDLIRLIESSLDQITLIGQAAFTAENQVRWVSKDGSTTIFINGNADLAADMAITLQGISFLGVGDFQLA